MTSAIAFAPSGRIHSAIVSAAASTGTDFGYLINQARVESGFNANARARTSSATGLYQFIEQSWLGTVKTHGAAHGMAWAADAITRGADGRYRVADAGTRAAILDLRREPGAAAAMAAELAADNKVALEARLGRETQPVDLYLAHFLGLGGATKFLRAADGNPDQSAAQLFPAAARANRSVFFARDGSARSLAQVRDRFSAKFDAAPGQTPGPADEAPATRWAARTAPVPDRAAPAVQPATVRLAYLMLASLGVS